METIKGWEAVNSQKGKLCTQFTPYLRGSGEKNYPKPSISIEIVSDTKVKGKTLEMKL